MATEESEFLSRDVLNVANVNSYTTQLTNDVNEWLTSLSDTSRHEEKPCAAAVDTNSQPSSKASCDITKSSCSYDFTDANETDKKVKKSLYSFKLLQAHVVKRNQGPKKYRCDICGKIYKYVFSLKRHFLKNHISIRYISKSDLSNCNITTFSLCDQEAASSDCSSETSHGTPSKKRHCSHESIDKSHLSPVLSGLYRCHVCKNESFDEKSQLQVHYKMHPSCSKTSFPCKKCDLVFSHKQTLFRHMISHAGANTFPCATCGQSFDTKSSYMKHCATHTGTRTCKICNKVLSTSANKRRHERIHEGLQPYPCKYCELQFTQIEDLKKHMTEKHQDRCIPCSICKNVFSSRAALKKHMLDKHKSMPKPPPVKNGPSTSRVNNFTQIARSMSGKETKKTYSCAVCKKSFRSILNMTRHRRQTHSLPQERRKVQRRPVRVPLPKPMTPEEISKAKEEELARIEKEFYSKLPENIAENLLNHVDGKTSQLSLREYNFSDQLEHISSIPSQSWSSYNFPTEFDVDSALKNRGNEIRNKASDSTSVKNNSYLYSPMMNGFETSDESGRIIYGEADSYDSSDCSESEIHPFHQRFYVDYQNMNLEERKKLIGRMVEIVYICFVCRDSFSSKQSFEDHSVNNHPNVVCSYIEIEGEKDVPPIIPPELCHQFLSPVGVFFSCNVPPPISNGLNLNCTKCKSVFSCASDLHQHIITCGGKEISPFVRKMNHQRRIKRTMKNRIDTAIKRRSTKNGKEISRRVEHSPKPKRRTRVSYLKEQSKKRNTNKVLVKTKDAVGQSKSHLPNPIECPKCKLPCVTKNLLKVHISQCLKNVANNSKGALPKKRKKLPVVKINKKVKVSQATIPVVIQNTNNTVTSLERDNLQQLTTSTNNFVVREQSRHNSRERISPSLECIVNSIKEKLTSEELSPPNISIPWMDDEQLIVPSSNQLLKTSQMEELTRTSQMEVLETSQMEELTRTSQMQVLETSRMEELQKTSQAEELPGTSQMKELTRVSQKKDLPRTSQMKELPKISPIKGLPKASPMKELPKISPMKEHLETSQMNEFPEITQMKELTRVSQKKDLPRTSQTKKLPKISPVKGLPKASSMKELPKISPMKEHLETSQMKELPETSQMKELPKTSQMKELPETSQMKELTRVSQKKDPPRTSQMKELQKISPIKGLPKASPMKELPKISPMKELPKISPMKEFPRASEVKELSKMDLTVEVANLSIIHQPPELNVTADINDENVTVTDIKCEIDGVKPEQIDFDVIATINEVGDVEMAQMDTIETAAIQVETVEDVPAGGICEIPCDNSETRIQLPEHEASIVESSEIFDIKYEVQASKALKNLEEVVIRDLEEPSTFEKAPSAPETGEINHSSEITNTDSVIRQNSEMLSSANPSNETAIDITPSTSYSLQGKVIREQSEPSLKNENEKERKIKCPYCMLDFSYLTNFHRHTNICNEKGKKKEPEPASQSSPCLLFLPKKDEVEGSMLNLLRHQSRQSQMMKEAKNNPVTETKKFQSFTCDICHRIFLSYFKMLVHSVEHKLQNIDEQTTIQSPSSSVETRQHAAIQSPGPSSSVETEQHAAIQSPGPTSSVETEQHAAIQSPGPNSSVETEQHAAIQSPGPTSSVETEQHAAIQSPGPNSSVETEQHAAIQSPGPSSSVETEQHAAIQSTGPTGSGESKHSVAQSEGPGSNKQLDTQVTMQFPDDIVEQESLEIAVQSLGPSSSVEIESQIIVPNPVLEVHSVSDTDTVFKQENTLNDNPSVMVLNDDIPETNRVFNPTADTIISDSSPNDENNVPKLQIVPPTKTKKVVTKRSRKMTNSRLCKPDIKGKSARVKSSPKTLQNEQTKNGSEDPINNIVNDDVTATPSASCSVPSKTLKNTDEPSTSKNVASSSNLCTICKKTFTSINYKKRHMLLKHGKKPSKKQMKDVPAKAKKDAVKKKLKKTSRRAFQRQCKKTIEPGKKKSIKQNELKKTALSPVKKKK